MSSAPRPDLSDECFIMGCTARLAAVRRKEGTWPLRSGGPRWPESMHPSLAGGDYAHPSETGARGGLVHAMVYEAANLVAGWIYSSVEERSIFVGRLQMLGFCPYAKL